MKSKTVILLVVAVVCGLSASYMTTRLLADRNEKVAVLVAKQRIPAWTQVKNPEDLFESEDRPKNEVPKNALTKIESARDQILVRPMDRGEPLVAENLVDKSKSGLDVVLPAGKRAVAVRTTAEAVAGGFVLPGSRVDVIHSNRHGDKDSESHVVLQNILVRAVDQSARKPDDKPGVVPATVTMEVTPQQALTLARVKDTGSITLALRPVGDDKVDPDGFQPPVPPPPPPPKPEPPKPVQVAVQPPPPPEPPVEKTVLTIQNGSQWTRATYTTQEGETRSTIEKGESEAMALPPAPRNPAPRK